jgi:hypothetical protein
MKKIKLDIIVLIISVISLIWVVLYKTIFLQKEEIFKHANDFGEILYGILSSVIASGIFYFFVVYLDRNRKGKIVNEIVKHKLNSIAVGLFIIKKDTFPHFGLQYDDKIPDLEDFMEICKGIDLRTNAPNIPNTSNQPITWYEYFYYLFQSDNYNSKLLYQHIIYLDIELVELLDKIQYTNFQRALDSFRENGYTHEISGASGPFWAYLKDLEAITNYRKQIDKKKKP